MYQLKGYTRSSKILEWIKAIFSLGIEESYDFFRNYLRNCMMISDDDIDSERFCVFYWFNISCSTINRDNECDIFLFEFIEYIWLESVAISRSVRKSIWNDTTNLCQKSHEERSGRDPINIIISEYHDSFSIFFCSNNPLDGIFHIWHQKWIMEIMNIWCEK